MSFATSQQINKYLEAYKDVFVTFSKEIIEVLSFDVKQAFVKASGGQWPCIINSASMSGAKIICNLRFSFLDPDSKEPISFFVTIKLVGVSDYQMEDLALVTLAYTQRAPDALIERLGRIVEANVNAKRYATEKVVLTDSIMRRVALSKKETVVFVDEIPRRCILQNISFVGATVYIMGVASFLKNKAVTLKFDFLDPDTVITVKGHTIGALPLKDRKDLVSLTIEYESQSIPMNYKLYLNRYFELPKKLVAVENEEPEV